MAQYPEGNPGVHPIDPLTPVGQFRLAYGDIDSAPYDPVEPGFRDYEELSDAEIEVYISQGGDSIARAIGFYYLSLSGQAAKRTKMVKDYDLQVNLEKRAGDLRATAQIWFERADSQDASVAEDAFEIVPTGDSGDGDWIAEGTNPIWGRRYTWARWR